MNSRVGWRARREDRRQEIGAVVIAIGETGADRRQDLGSDGIGRKLKLKLKVKVKRVR